MPGGRKQRDRARRVEDGRGELLCAREREGEGRERGALLGDEEFVGGRGGGGAVVAGEGGAAGGGEGVGGDGG